MYRQEIEYSHETHDYAMYLDGELVGFARTYHEAEITLDLLVLELMSGQFFRQSEAEKPKPKSLTPLGRTRRGL